MGVREVSTAIAAPFPGAQWTTACRGFVPNMEQAGGQKLTILARLLQRTNRRLECLDPTNVPGVIEVHSWVTHIAVKIGA
eukprot:6951786-Prorocentrum_lima.AAC.1